MLAYPLRAVWADSPAGYAQQERVEFLISVPKRKLRHAVDRVKMRRRIREVMRYAGPRILFHHPVAAARHALSPLREKKRLEGER